jgi:hypothetical protein
MPHKKWGAYIWELQWLKCYDCEETFENPLFTGSNLVQRFCESCKWKRRLAVCSPQFRKKYEAKGVVKNEEQVATAAFSRLKKPKNTLSTY